MNEAADKKVRVISKSLDCGSLLPLSVASLLARGCPSIARSRLRDKSGSRLPQSKVYLTPCSVAKASLAVASSLGQFW